MPGYLLHQGTVAQCPHGGQAQFTAVVPRVKLMGQPVVVQLPPTIIAGCANPPPPSNVGPCTTVQWQKAATRIKAMGQPVLLEDSPSACLPINAPLLILLTQKRVKGT